VFTSKRGGVWEQKTKKGVYCEQSVLILKIWETSIIIDKTG